MAPPSHLHLGLAVDALAHPADLLAARPAPGLASASANRHNRLRRIRVLANHHSRITMAFMTAACQRALVPGIRASKRSAHEPA